MKFWVIPDQDNRQIRATHSNANYMFVFCTSDKEWKIRFESWYQFAETKGNLGECILQTQMFL